MAYCFCSGYGLMWAYTHAGGDKKKYLKGRLPGLWKFIKTYWIILALFACVALALGNGEKWLGSPLVFLGNATSVWYTYNGAWWFVSTYIFMVLLSPWVFSVVKKYPKVTAIVAAAVYVLSYQGRFNGPSDILVQHATRLGMSYAELLLGVYFYQYKIMGRVQRWWNLWIPKWLQIWLLVIIVVVVIGVRRYVATLFIAPVSGLIFILAYILLSRKHVALQSIFGFFGMHSTNMWLTHMFFYLPMYGGLAYYAKYDVLVFAALVATSVAASYLVKGVQKVMRIMVYGRLAVDKIVN